MTQAYYCETTDMTWHMLHPKATIEHLGFLPEMVSNFNMRPAKEQLDRNYQHGGGWRPFQGFRLHDLTLTYPGDPPMQPIAITRLRDEVIAVYEHSWVAIIQAGADGSFEVCRMD